MAFVNKVLILRHLWSKISANRSIEFQFDTLLAKHTYLRKFTLDYNGNCVEDP